MWKVLQRKINYKLVNFVLWPKNNLCSTKVNYFCYSTVIFKCAMNFNKNKKMQAEYPTYHFASSE